jgi:hypothetical protein
MQQKSSEAVSILAGVLVQAGQDPPVVEPHAVQDQPGHELAVENVYGAEAAGVAAGANEVKCAWGTMWTCSALECPGGTTHYSSFKPADPQQPHVVPQNRTHAIPSLLCKDVDKQPFPYVALRKDIQATCANGWIPLVGNQDHEQVFVPYRPVGRHG